LHRVKCCFAYPNHVAQLEAEEKDAEKEEKPEYFGGSKSIHKVFQGMLEFCTPVDPIAYHDSLEEKAEKEAEIEKARAEKEAVEKAKAEKPKRKRTQDGATQKQKRPSKKQAPEMEEQPKTMPPEVVPMQTEAPKNICPRCDQPSENPNARCNACEQKAAAWNKAEQEAEERRQQQFEGSGRLPFL
jgi:hypothetical protein